VYYPVEPPQHACQCTGRLQPSRIRIAHSQISSLQDTQGAVGLLSCPANKTDKGDLKKVMVRADGIKQLNAGKHLATHAHCLYNRMAN